MPLAKMEAIQQKFNDLLYNTWIMQSSVELTNTILDNGDRPAVLSAIMKQQTTDRARIVLNETMDIHAGASICLGFSNFLENFYRCAPVAVIVEGLNTLTQSLVIFGQELNKSHPHIFQILDDILQNNEDEFMKSFRNIVNHFLSLYSKSFSLSKSLEQNIRNFACLTNFVALKGCELKREQMLSDKIQIKIEHVMYGSKSKIAKLKDATTQQEGRAGFSCIQGRGGYEHTPQGQKTRFFLLIE